MGAKSNRTRVSFVEEATWGVTPVDPDMQKLNWTAESLNYALETTTPDTVRDDRMVSDVLRLSGGNDGGFEFEMQALFSGEFDTLLLGALWFQSWLGVNFGSPSLDAQDGVITQSSKVMDLSGATDQGTMVIGQKFWIVGSAQGNDGLYTVAATGGAGVYTLKESPAADETFGAGVTVNGQMANNGLFRHSYTFERSHLDIDEHFLFTGMVVNEFSLSFEAGDKVTGSFSFIGKNTGVSNDEIGDSYVDAPLTNFMTASFNVRNVFLDDVPIEACLLMGLEININNNVEGKMAVGDFGYCNTSEGEFENTGSISLYFNNSDMYNRFTNGTPFSLSFELFDADNAYVFTMPRIKLSNDTVNATGKNTDIMDEAEYVSIVDPETECVIQIDRYNKITP